MAGMHDPNEVSEGEWLDQHAVSWELREEIRALLQQIATENKLEELRHDERQNFSLRRAVIDGTYLTKAELRKFQQAQYEINIDKQKGEQVQCPSCGIPFVKNHPSQKFCSNQRSGIRKYNKGVMNLNCQDWYWNRFDERKRRYAVDVLGL